MDVKLLNADKEKTFAIIFEEGDEFHKGMLSFAQKEDVRAAHFTAIGAFSRAVLAFFDIKKKEYIEIPVNEQVEVLSLVGDIALKGDEPEIHAHAVLGRVDGSTVGGHIMEAYVDPTLEVMLTEPPGYLRRKVDERTGLALISV